MRRLLPLLLAGVLAAGYGSAGAGERYDVRVDLRDLNPATPAGALATLNRIKAGARRASGVAPDMREIAAYSRWRAGYRLAVERAVLQVGSGQLEALYRASAPRRRITPTQTAESSREPGRVGRL